jgi:hypothetical protein
MVYHQGEREASGCLRGSFSEATGSAWWVGPTATVVHLHCEGDGPFRDMGCDPRASRVLDYGVVCGGNLAVDTGRRGNGQLRNCSRGLRLHCGESEMRVQLCERVLLWPGRAVAAGRMAQGGSS